MSSQCPCAGPITGITIALEMSKRGGLARLLIPLRLHEGSGSRRDELNEGDRSFLSSSLPEASQKRKDGGGVLGSRRRSQCPWLLSNRFTESFGS